MVIIVDDDIRDDTKEDIEYEIGDELKVFPIYGNVEKSTTLEKTEINTGFSTKINNKSQDRNQY